MGHLKSSFLPQPHLSLSWPDPWAPPVPAPPPPSPLPLAAVLQCAHHAFCLAAPLGGWEPPETEKGVLHPSPMCLFAYPPFSISIQEPGHGPGALAMVVSIILSLCSVLVIGWLWVGLGMRKVLRGNVDPACHPAALPYPVVPSPGHTQGLQT